MSGARGCATCGGNGEYETCPRGCQDEDLCRHAARVVVICPCTRVETCDSCGRPVTDAGCEAGCDVPSFYEGDREVRS